jgi:hypothetical protein
MTPTPTPEVPEWAREVLDAFAGLSYESHGHLTKAEEDLLGASWLLLRARFGRTSIPDPQRVAGLMVRDALAALDAEADR